MKASLVSLNKQKKGKSRTELVKKAINSVSSDLILFCGSTLDTPGELTRLRRSLKEGHPIIILEANKSWYRIEDCKAIPFKCNQKFIKAEKLNEENCKEYLQDFIDKRTFQVGNKRVLLLVCGENNLLINKKDRDMEAEFRYKSNKELASLFNSLICNSDVILNPLHSPWGSWMIRILNKRAEFFSKNKRVYLSACKSGLFAGKELKASANVLQKAYKNRSVLECCDQSLDDNISWRTYSI